MSEDADVAGLGLEYLAVEHQQVAQVHAAGAEMNQHFLTGLQAAGYTEEDAARRNKAGRIGSLRDTGGAVFVKHFELATNDTNPNLRKRLLNDAMHLIRRFHVHFVLLRRKHGFESLHQFRARNRFDSKRADELDRSSIHA